MRANEFISENKGKSHHEQMSTLPPGITLNNMDSFYEYYKFLNAVAAYPNTHTTYDHDHFADNPVAFAYTPEEREMLIQSAKRMGKKIKHISKEKSSDPEGTNAASPVPHNSGRRKK
jgi:hypothetical protein